MFCFLDGSREALSGLLREGRAGSNTTADHITVLDQALAQIPDAQRYGTEILVRSDSAGCTHGFLAHIRTLRGHGIDARFSVGVAITEPIREAIGQAAGWIPAIDADGDLRDGAEICEITGLVPADGYPDDTRFIVRRERPYPGAQLSLFDTIEGPTCSPGPSTCSCTANWPPPSPRSCATGCCTCPPASPAPPAAPTYASPRAGPGSTNSSPRSPAWPPCPDRSPERPRPIPPTRTPEEPGHRAGAITASVYREPTEDQQNQVSNLDQQLTKDRG